MGEVVWAEKWFGQTYRLDYDGVAFEADSEAFSGTIGHKRFEWHVAWRFFREERQHPFFQTL